MNTFLSLAPWMALALGLIARVFVPWLAKRLETPQEAKWQWKYVWPQVVAVGLLLLLLPLLVDDLAGMSGVPWQLAWLSGWAAGDIGRKTYKALAKEED